MLPALGRPDATHAGTAPETGSGPTPDRATSLLPSIAPGGSGWYRWNDVQPGTYLYHSGTHMQVQMQMGLYGAMFKRGPTPGRNAYANDDCAEFNGLGNCHRYRDEALLLFSEIDSGFHSVVVDGFYGSPGFPTSTINYNPDYYLINGEPYPNSPSNIFPYSGIGGAYLRTSLNNAGTTLVENRKVLLRLVNAGLKPHSVALHRPSPNVDLDADNVTMMVHAEDGNVYPHPQERVAVMLPAGQTKDAFLYLDQTDEDAGELVVFDRFLNLSNAGTPDGGMMVRLPVGASGGGGGTPASMVAVDDEYPTSEDAILVIPDATGVLLNDDGSVPGALPVGPGGPTFDTTAGGSVTLAYGGGFSYTPPGDFSGIDSFQYLADGGGNVATVRLSVVNVNDDPIAIDDGPITVVAGNTINRSLLGNDHDPDGDALTVVATPPAGVTLNGDGSITVDGSIAVSGVFTYDVTDDFGGMSAISASVTIDVIPADGPTVTVVDSSGAGIGSGFRWVLEEDRSFRAPLGVRDIENSLSFNFHKSYMPVVASGRASGSSATLPALDPLKHYHVSVLPDSGYDVGGVSIPGDGSGGPFEALVQPHSDASGADLDLRVRGQPVRQRRPRPS